MDIEIIACPQGLKRRYWTGLLQRCALEPDDGVERTVLIWEDGDLAATGSRQGNVLKCIAVDPAHQGSGLTATLLTQLRQDAFAGGFSHLFLYTKPSNRWMFQSLFFYPVVQPDKVLLMENRSGGISEFIWSLDPVKREGKIGAAVMNCNPFTLGHRYLIETASKECDHVYVFVLSEDASRFSAVDRMAMVKAGTADLENVTVLPTGPYLISSATFPTYFLKDRENSEQVHCQLDVEIFGRWFVPAFGITRRYVGTEPFSVMTDSYNRTLAEHLPEFGVELHLVPRLEKNGIAVSATTVRSLLECGDFDNLRRIVPETTYEYLREHGFLKTGG